MSDVPRKLLIVKREPAPSGFTFVSDREALKRISNEGYNIMIESNNRTMSLQVDSLVGEEIMSRLQSVILEYAVQRGWVAPIQSTAKITNRKRRK